MTIADRFRSLFGSAPSAPEGDLLERAMGSPNGGGTTGLYQNQSGTRKGSEEVLALYRESPRLRAVAHKVASAVASAEWKLYARRDPSSTKEDPRYLAAPDLVSLSLQQRHGAVARAVADGDVEEISSHPALRLLNRPNRAMSGFAARLVTQVHLDLVGDAFWIVDENDAGMPIRAWPIPPSWVTRIPSETEPSFGVSFAGFAGSVPSEHMVWFKDVDPSEPYSRGSGLGLALADELDIDEHAAKTVASWFQNSGMPSMLVSLKGASQPAVERARSRWDRTLKGFRRAYQTYFTGADINVQRLDTSFKDMALVDIRKDVRDAVNQTWGVPPEKLGIIENSNKATSEAADLIFVKDVVIPRLELMRQELQWKLVSRYDPRLIIDFVSPLPEDRETKNAVAAALSTLFTIDEHRARAGLAPLPGGDGAGFMVGTRWVRQLRDLEQRTGNAPIFGYHLASGAMTNNELRASLGLAPSAESWGGARTVGSFSPALPPAEPAPAPLLALPPANPPDPDGAPPPDDHALAGFSASPEDVAAEVARRARAARLLRRRWATRKEVKGVLAAVDDAVLSGLVVPEIGSLVVEWGGAITALATKGARSTFDVAGNVEVAAFLGGFAKTRLDRIGETTRTALRSVLEDWDGDDDAVLLRSVRSVFDTARTTRAPLIASVEGQFAGQFAASAAMRAPSDLPGEIVEMKEWLSVMDGRTREAHRELDGQKILATEDYEVPGGEWAGRKAAGPGQFGEPALDFNCRCFSVPFFEDAENVEDERRKAWEREDARLRRWEARLSDAVTLACDEQERRALAAVSAILAG